MAWINTSTSNIHAASTTKHIVIFPFMSKGHTIPLIHLSYLLFQHELTLTFFSTPANSPFLHSSHGATPATVVDLPFPERIHGILPGVESTNKLPSMDLFDPFLQATKLHPPITCIVYDSFLSWAQTFASKLSVPGFIFYGINTFSMTMCQLVITHKPHRQVSHADEPFSVPGLDHIMLRKHDLSEPFTDPDPKGPQWDFFVESMSLLSECSGLIVNSFYKLEPTSVDYYNENFSPKACCVDPLRDISPWTGSEPPRGKSTCEQWLDHVQATQRPVLYMAFGTQAQIPEAQLREIATGLEEWAPE